LTQSLTAVEENVRTEKITDEEGGEKKQLLRWDAEVFTPEHCDNIIQKK
jgi:hypothetical protein